MTDGPEPLEETGVPFEQAPGLVWLEQSSLAGRTEVVRHDGEEYRRFRVEVTEVTKP